MIALGVLVLIVWAVLAVVGAAIEILLKVALGLIILGAIFDVATRFRLYTRRR